MAASPKPENAPDPSASFSEWGIDEARAVVEDALPPEAEVNELFVAGDHWQEGDGWVGPTPPVDDSDFDITLDLIKENFTSRNVIREIVQRRMRGVIGQEPRFGVVPRGIADPTVELTDAQKKAKLEIEAALTEWWDARKVHEIFQDAVSKASWATQATIRLFVPRGLLVDDEVPDQKTLADALKFVFVESPEPTQSTVEEDDDTRDEIGVLITQMDGSTRVELCYLGPADTNGVRPTIIRTITEESGAGGTTTEEEFELELGGRITMSAIETDLLITAQQQQMQRALNLCQSMIPHNIVTGGFLERIILNGLPPGHWEDKPGSGGRGQKVFVREPFVTGAGVTSWIRGLELPQKDGSSQITTPAVAFREPVDPKFAADAKRSIYLDMLEEADQSHVMITSDANASGKSREQARADYGNSLTELEAPTNSTGRWLIETVLAMAETFMKQPGVFLNEWRGQFECKLNTGPISIEERQQNVNEVKEGLLSDETAMERNGVTDVAAEQARIAAAPDSDLNTTLTRSQIVQNLTQGGADIEGAAEIAGFENPKRLVPDDVPPTDVPPTNPPIPAPAAGAGGAGGA